MLVAKPRVFVSSTYFDLRVIRADIARFIKEIGYEPVLFERGHIPYGKEEPLEEYCYNEISTCDIVVAIIGGRIGSTSKDSKNSITQKELKTAIDNGKQVYIFVERSVHAEYRTYENNKELKDFKPVSVDSTQVFQFLESVYALPGGNPVEPFEISEDITRYLREQWSGLFQRLLQESARQREINIIENLQSTTATLNSIVKLLSEERTKGVDAAIKDILLSSHPAFAAIKKSAQIPYRVVFYTFDELDTLLTARQFTREEFTFDDDIYEWRNGKSEYGIEVNKNIFDESGKLKIFSLEEWEEDWIKKFDIKKTAQDDDDIPF